MIWSILEVMYNSTSISMDHGANHLLWSAGKSSGGLCDKPDTSYPIHLYFCPSDELSLFQLIFIVRSYVVLLYHCPGLGEGWDPANTFNPATLCMFVPVPSQEPVIQWLSFVYVLHFCF